LEKLLSKAHETVNASVKARARLDGGFTLWGEPLIAAHLAAGCKRGGKTGTGDAGQLPQQIQHLGLLCVECEVEEYAVISWEQYGG
jgi:hypothetical protein